MTRHLVLLLALSACSTGSVQGEQQEGQLQQQQADEGGTSGTGAGTDEGQGDGGDQGGGGVWSVRSETLDCGTGDLVDANLEIRKGVPVQVYLLVSDGYGVSAWVDAREGTLLWGADGKADVVCTYSGRDAEWWPIVEGARVTWAEQR